CTLSYLVGGPFDLW
nr:immunoglobulin heavy chain junction region [Macaca mulatta]MOW75394.1 immunoglobulin heavy chain junction region [Macaca mulatta]MOW75893.1 immunoglobulin heavy chain junction region [Macaca mulatta]MOW76509.1 immunoglobulin heavy chain junction region [Macaca mulatta]MOW76584.1 immunoglobulin heavy chain junction region [Macaca mulatta]